MDQSQSTRKEICESTCGCSPGPVAESGGCNCWQNYVLGRTRFFLSDEPARIGPFGRINSRSYRACLPLRAILGTNQYPCGGKFGHVARGRRARREATTIYCLPRLAADTSGQPNTSERNWRNN